MLSSDKLEVRIDLGFGVFVDRHVLVAGLPVPASLPLRCATQIKHCLIVLLGGRRLFIAPQADAYDNVSSRVFLAERVQGAPIGLTEGLVQKPVLDVTPFLLSLAPLYDVDAVKSLVNGSA